MSQTNSNIVSVRYMIDDVDAAVAFYTNHLGFRLEIDASPAFASVVRGNLRLLLSGEKSSGRQPLADGTKPVPGGWNRILLEVSDIAAEFARLRAAAVKFRREDVFTGPGAHSFGWLIRRAIWSNCFNRSSRSVSFWRIRRCCDKARVERRKSAGHDPAVHCGLPPERPLYWR
jgi:catechol 2,3-dioxygenase-like lactoylglutathione lyase family enzyme